jgi:hypothetical protein
VCVMKKRGRKKWRGRYVCDEKGGMEEEEKRKEKGIGAVRECPGRREKKNEKEERKERGKKGRERMSGILVPLWMVVRR